MTGVIVGNVYYNTDSGLSAPGGLLDRMVNPDTQLKQRQLGALDMFANGLPTDASGNPDFPAMARRAFEKGAIDPGIKLLEAGISQRQITDASKLTDGMTKWLGPGSSSGDAQPTTAPGATPTRGANPEVVQYFRSRAPAYGINPNAALSVASKEGLFGFDPAGKPNPGDNNSSFGPLQLHYGGVASGGNAAPGLGDDFTKATGLDARDPSTWKAQIDFALGHAAQHGWGAWHGAINSGIGEWTGINRGGAAPTSDGRPIQLAQNEDSDAPPISKHPYAPSAPPVLKPSEAPRAQSFAPTRPTPDTPVAAGSPTELPPEMGSPTPRPAPLPTSFAAPPPISPNAGAPTAADDPSYGGQVPLAWLKAGHSAADWVRYQRTMAAIGSGNPFAKGAAEQWSKSADGLQQSIEKRNELTPDQKNARDPVAFAAEIEKEKARGRARADAEAENALVPVAQPDGSMTLMPKKVAMAQAAQGGTVLHSLPGYVTSGQAELRQKLETGAAAYQERQVAGERLGALSNLLSVFQTGSGSTALNNAVARLRTFGIEVPNSAMTNPAAMQQFVKNTYASTLSTMREQGNKQFVSELQSAIGSNPNAELQPEANAAMIAQMRGIQQYHDQNFRDYSEWYESNRGASNDAKFQIDWAKKHPVEPFITAARKDIAPLGAALPPPGQLVDGQAYMVQGRSGPVRARWNAAAKHFIPARD